jgi:3-hydroxyphenylacetate 6-hydroxylase
MAVTDLLYTLAGQAQDHPLSFLAYCGALAALTYFVINEATRSQARIPAFKGPRGLPVIGNLWDIRTNAAEQYRSWSKTWGDAYQIQLGNIPVIVVNSAAAAKTIFGQQSQALSSRPEFYTFHKVGFSLYGWSDH